MLPFSANGTETEQGSASVDAALNYPKTTASLNTSGLLQGAAANARRIIMGFPPVNDENQQNTRIQQAVNRYNGNVPVYCRPSAAYKCNLLKLKSLKSVTQQSIEMADNLRQNPETRYASAGPGHLPVVLLSKDSLRPTKSYKVLAKLKSTDTTGLPNSRFLDDTSEKYSDLKSTRSVLEVLHDLSRKRIHGKDDAEEPSKRRCNGLAGGVSADGQVPYRPLFVPKNKAQLMKKDQTTQTLQNGSAEESVGANDNKLELRRRLAQMNNEITASLSSSLDMINFTKRKRVSDSELKPTELDLDNSALKKPKRDSSPVSEKNIEMPTSSREDKPNIGPRSPQTKDKLMRIYWDMPDSIEMKRNTLETLKNNPGESQFKNSARVESTASPSLAPIISIHSLASSPLPSPASPIIPIHSLASSPLPSAASPIIPVHSLASSPLSSPPINLPQPVSPVLFAADEPVKVATSQQDKVTSSPSAAPPVLNFSTSQWNTAPIPKPQFTNTKQALLFGTSKTNDLPQVTFGKSGSESNVLDNEKAAPMKSDIKTATTNLMTPSIAETSSLNMPDKNVTPNLLQLRELSDKNKVETTPKDTTLPDSAPKLATPPSNLFSFGLTKNQQPPSISPATKTFSQNATTFSLALEKSTATNIPVSTSTGFSFAGKTANNNTQATAPVSSALGTFPPFTIGQIVPAASAPSVPFTETVSAPGLFSFGTKSSGESKIATESKLVANSPATFTSPPQKKETQSFSVFGRLGDKLPTDNREKSDREEMRSVSSATTSPLSMLMKTPAPATVGPDLMTSKSTTLATTLAPSNTTTNTNKILTSTLTATSTTVSVISSTTETTKPIFSFGNTTTLQPSFNFGQSAGSSVASLPVHTSISSSIGMTSTANTLSKPSPSVFSFGSTATPSSAVTFGGSNETNPGATFSFGGLPSISKENPIPRIDSTPITSAVNATLTFGCGTVPATTTVTQLPALGPSTKLPFQIGSNNVFGNSASNYKASSSGLTLSTSLGMTQSQTTAQFSSMPVTSTVEAVKPTTSFAAVPGSNTAFGTPGFGVAPTVTTSAPTFTSTAAFSSIGPFKSSATPTFGATTSATPAFGSTSSTFGTNSFMPESSKIETFGTTSSATASVFGSSAPAFGTAPTSATFGSSAATLAFGTANTVSTFGNSLNTSSAFGMPTTNPPSYNSSQAFGTAVASAPSFGTNNTSSASISGTTPFAFSAPQNSPSSVFNFGSTPATAPANAPPAPFAFGSASSANSSGSSVFNFGSSSASGTGGAFNFGSSQAPLPGPMTFGAQSPGTFSSIPGTFSIGTRSTQPRSRGSRLRRKP